VARSAASATNDSRHMRKWSLLGLRGARPDCSAPDEDPSVAPQPVIPLKKDLSTCDPKSHVRHRGALPA
jgi:hypothetical protein